MIFYSPAEGKAEERLGAMIEKLIPGVMTKTCRTIDALSNRLSQLHNDLTIAVLLAADKADLFNLSSISEQFHDARIIVVAPDQDKDTVALAHRLRPRLLTYTDSDFAEVFAVLNNIMSEHHGLNNFHNMYS
jgi:DNA-binding NarL/FixJ family response regulator